MSNNIDKRIVEMQFDNQQFESNVKTSLSTLDSLKKGLDLSGASKGFDELDKAVSKVDMNTLGSAVEAVKVKFSALETIATTALVNITNEAVNAGKQLLASLSVDQISAGWGKYAEKTSAVQTIMAATAKDFDDTGEQMEYVNSQLEKLNWFTDETSYSFLDMVNNIGKFTSNRIPLDKSVTAMQGISNWAALSGANVAEAGRAMYNLAQAIAVGRVQLIDWKSIENANMATAEFKETAIETALAMGTLEKGADGVIRTLGGDEVSVSNFNSALTQGKWFTSEVLMNVLEQYGSFANELYKTTEKTGLTASELLSYMEDYEDGTLSLSDVAKKTGLSVEELDVAFKTLTSDTMNLGYRSFRAAQEAKTFKESIDSVKDAVSTGWMNTFEIIFGNYQEAKVLWTDLANAMYDAFASSAEARNELLSGWRDLGGRDLLIESFWNTWEGIANIIGTVKGAFRNIFPPATSEQLYRITEKLHEFTDRLKKLSENTDIMNKVARVFSGVAAALDIVKTGLGWVLEGFKRLVGFVEPVASKALDWLANIGDSIVRFRNRIKTSKTIQTVLQNIYKTIDTVREIALDTFGTVIRKIGELWTAVKKYPIFSKIGSAIVEFTGKIPGFIQKVREWSSSLFEHIRSSETLQDIWSELKGVAEDVWAGISGIFSKAGKTISEVWNRLKQSDFFSKIGEGATNFAKKIPSAIRSFRDWIKSIYEYVRSSETLSKAWIKVRDFMRNSIKDIGNFGRKLRDAVSAFFTADVSGKETLGEKIKARLFAAFGSLSDWFDGVKRTFQSAWEDVKEFFSNFFATVLPEFFSSLNEDAGRMLGRIGSIDWSSIRKTISDLIGIVSLIRFISTFATIGKSFKNIGKGIKNIGRAFKDLGKSLKDLAKDGLKITNAKKDSIGTTLLKIATSIGILVAAMVVLSKMDTTSIMKSLAVIAALGTELSLISLTFRNGAVDGKSFIMMAGAISLMVLPITLLSKMDTVSAMKGILGIGLIMTEMAIFTRIAKNGFTGKTGFLSMALSINLLVVAIKQIAGINTGGLIKGLGMLGVLFLELSLFMKKADGIKVSGLIGLSVALNIMTLAVKSLGSMDFGTLAKGVAAISGLLTSFGLLFKMTGNVKLGTSVALLLTLAGTLILFVETFKQIDGFDPTAMLSFSGSISAVLLALAGSLKILSAMPMVGTLKGIGNLAIAIAGVGTILTGLGALQNVWTELPAFIKDGGAILGLIGSAIGQFFGGIAGGFVVGLDLPTIGAELSDFIVNAAPFLQGVGSIGEDTKNGVKNLTDAMFAINGAEINTWWASLFSGGNSIEKFKTDLTTLAEALVGYANGVLPLNEVSDDTLSRSISVATSLTEVLNKMPTTDAWSRFLGESRDMTGFSADVKTLATVLVDFCSNISALDDTSFDQNKINAAIAAATGLSELESSLEGQGGVEDEWEGIKSLAGFGVRINSFGQNLQDFISDVSLITYNPDTDGPKITALIGISTALAELETNLEGQGGYEDAIEGIKSLSTFGAEIPQFATNLNASIEQFRSIVYDSENDGAKIDAVIGIATRLASLENTLKEHGGSIQALMGDATLSSLAAEFPDFATGINSFISIVSGIADEDYNPDKVNTAIEIANKLGEFESSLTRTGGSWQAFWGEKDVGLFSENIKLLGRALRSFAINVTSIDADSAANAISTMNMVGEFIDNLTASGGWLQSLATFFSGGATTENTFDNLCSMITQFGETMGVLSENLGKVSGLGLMVKMTMAKMVFNTFTAFVEGLTDPSNSLKRFRKYGDAIVDMGEYLNDFSDEAVKCDNAGILLAISSISSLIGLCNQAASIDPSNVDNIGQMLEAYSGLDLSSAGENLGKSFVLSIATAIQSETGGFAAAITRLSTVGVKAMNATSGLWKNSIRTLSSNVIQTLQSATPSFAATARNLSISGANSITATQSSWNNCAKTLVTNLINGIANARSSMTTAASSLSNAGASSASGTQKSWYSAGQNLGKGLANGVRSMASKVKSAAASAAAGAVSAVRNAWKVHSPSRVGLELGMYFDYGLAEGLNSYRKVVSQNAESVSSGAAESARMMLANLSTGILDNIDPNPTIRPVLDLSNVEQGVGVINGMFSANRSLSTSMFNGAASYRNVKALAFDGSRIAGGSGNKDVVAELQQLTQRFNNLTEAVTNMQLVLDTGTLVGATSAKMDSQLGTLVSRRGRGN